MIMFIMLRVEARDEEIVVGPGDFEILVKGAVRVTEMPPSILTTHVAKQTRQFGVNELQSGQFCAYPRQQLVV